MNTTSQKKSGSAAHKLRERVKELSCLYEIAQISGRPAASLPEILQGVAEALPAAWQRSKNASARVMLDGAEFCSGAMLPPDRGRIEPIMVRGECRGEVAVGYPSLPPDSVPSFLEEEDRLLGEVARQVGLIVDRRETAAEQERLRAKLRHADRLATIGRLAAGVAHELNEPLGGILGFAQLLAKTPDLPDQARADISKIEAATLHARDIIRHLMVFARQTPPCDKRVDFNRLIRDSEAIWGARCAAAGVQLVYALDPDIPEIIADDRQLRQVVTNLVVNAIQAMPNGGSLKIETSRNGTWIRLLVKDEGIGIAPELLPRLFDPFFTTKDVNEGSGLGLSIVHGIVTGHEGTISLESTPDCGTAVTVQLPIHRPPTHGESHEQA
ncbi:sensor histidine kinase [Tichowtungia aerotolerans]|uniref:histidine kinase n=1 Tax=Tichowtungia aerotolerans TaxID=2697043 RepID=A0A6P1MDG7_9BACT|nr:ATP-binding protein [Tichowtungia aerotolerans]QHI69636.1 PAS domain-containing sensor histidine kinase [Tichowtungia aerotolerans]